MADPVGEEAWLAYLESKKLSANELEHRVTLVELYQNALSAEPYSLKLWLAYCEYVWSLYQGSHAPEPQDGWTEEEQQLGQELFNREMALDAWSQGATATKYRLADSHELWDRWAAVELEELARAPDADKIEHLRDLFVERLQTPHAAWDQTSQTFSQFLTRYDEPAWESAMVAMTKLAKPAKDLYAAREMFELKLRSAVDSGDREQIWTAAKAYLDWEDGQLRKKGQDTWAICVALHERVLSMFSDSAALWQDYVALIGSQHTFHKMELRDSPKLLSVLQRATGHCPWSGALWARYILRAEMEDLPFTEIEQIKHSATNKLPQDALNDVVEVYLAWCGYLKRNALAVVDNYAIDEPVDEDDQEIIDMADVGYSSAFESIQQLGKQLYGTKEFKGDPSYRLERQFIEYLTVRDSDTAREQWKILSKAHGDSYEFWQRFYAWEMQEWARTKEHPRPPPDAATTVLSQALLRKNLDWPEKIMEMLVQHTSDFLAASQLLDALDTVHRVSNGVMKRRQREALEAQQQPAAVEDNVQVETTEAMEVDSSTSAVTKRKRSTVEEETPAKKVKEDHDNETAAEQQKRDRENTTVIVSNLPAEVTQTKVRQYFKGYGHINSLTLKTEEDKASATALVEFRSTEDVQSALIRDGKYFNDRQIRVESGAGLTLYVTNYPPTADEDYIRNLFVDCGEILSIRWPSLKFNTHRRFCYVTFRTTTAASAATQLDGNLLDGRYKLEAKYSDPSRKKAREGAMSEGRELHVGNIERSTTEDELKDVFSKFGPIESIRLLRTMAGKSKGAGFVVFEQKAHAEAALDLDKSKFKGQLLTVELAKPLNYKPTATVRDSPGPDSTKDGAAASHSPHSENPDASHDEASREAIASRTVALMNLPDTVNAARVQALVEPYGPLVKLVLRPDHQGAIVEFRDVSSAGKAALGLENHEIVPGRHLRTGSVKDLLREKEEFRQDRIQVGGGGSGSGGPGDKKSTSRSSFVPPPSSFKRPVVKGSRGVKRGLGFVPATVKSKDVTTSTSGGGGDSTDAASNKGEEKAKPKSNADFRALINGN